MNFNELSKNQVKAACKELSMDSEELESVLDDGDYMILTEEEADEKSKEYILDTIWAFNASFLSGETGIDEEVFTAIQANNRCESNNDAIMSIIKSTCGVDSFVESAISADGRGHFLSSYDGNETEIRSSEDTLYAYRIN